MAVILLVWSPLEDWEAVGSSPDSVEKVLLVVSSHLLDKVSWTSAGTVSWIFLTTLKVSIDSVLRDAILVHDVQRCSEELEQCMLSLEQEPCGPEEPSICVRELVSDGNDECYETVGPRLAERPLFSGK